MCHLRVMRHCPHVLTISMKWTDMAHIVHAENLVSCGQYETVPFDFVEGVVCPQVRKASLITNLQYVF